MPPRKLSPVGAHVLVAGGLARTGLAYAREIGAEAVQVFVSNPRGWAQAKGDPGQDDAFVSGCADAKLPVFVHAPYLVNFGSPTAATLEGSVAAVRHSLQRGRALCARGVVVHAGSQVAGGGYDDALRQVRERLRPLLDELTDDSPDLLIELTAGGRGALAGTPDQLPAYLDALDWHPKVGVCVDTCHIFAAGYAFGTVEEYDGMIGELDRAVGPGRVRVWHLNDSRRGRGSRVDRHEGIGRGHLGLEPFRNVLNDPRFRAIPMILETPKGSDGGEEFDVLNLRVLRLLECPPAATA